jgi:hypothetical protein
MENCVENAKVETNLKIINLLVGKTYFQKSPMKVCFKNMKQNEATVVVEQH